MAGNRSGNRGVVASRPVDIFEGLDYALESYDYLAPRYRKRVWNISVTANAFGRLLDSDLEGVR